MSEMTIGELQQLRETLEAKLRRVAAEVVDEFQQRTGVYVDGVRVELLEVTTLADKGRRSVISSVRIEAQL